jgi:membrane associated rhomboid family serine protease
VAYWAHIGGFLFGLAVALSLRRADAEAPAAPV